METERLEKVCAGMEYNFFSLFCPVQERISAYLAAVSIQGDAKNLVGDAALITELEKTKEESNGKDGQIELLTQRVHDLELQIQRLEANLKDKDVIIELLKERRK